MVQSKAKTVSEYLKSLNKEDQKVIQKLRAAYKKHLPKGIKESMNWGMIAYEVPLSVYPDTYNGQPLMVGALARQKNHFGVYLSALYSDPKVTSWFKKEWRKRTKKKLNMGKSCVRITSLDDIPIELFGEVIGKMSTKDFVKMYEKARKSGRGC